jgi:hypothetical protein
MGLLLLADFLFHRSHLSLAGDFSAFSLSRFRLRTLIRLARAIFDPSTTHDLANRQSPCALPNPVHGIRDSDYRLDPGYEPNSSDLVSAATPTTATFLRFIDLEISTT